MPLHAFKFKWRDAAIDFPTWIFIHQQFHYTSKSLTRSISLSHLIETVFHSLSRFNSHALQFSWKFKFPPNGRRNVLQCKRKTVWKWRRNTRRKTGTSRATNKTTQSLLKNTMKSSHNTKFDFPFKLFQFPGHWPWNLVWIFCTIRRRKLCEIGWRKLREERGEARGIERR